MFDWVDILENKLDSMSPVGTDLETVKQQMVELKVKCCICITAEYSYNSLMLLLMYFFNFTAVLQRLCNIPAVFVFSA